MLNVREVSQTDVIVKSYRELLRLSVGSSLPVDKVKRKLVR